MAFLFSKGEGKSDKKIKVDESEELPTLAQELIGYFWEKDKLTDVTFIIGDKKISAHRMILAAASPVFEGMLFSRKSDGSPDPALPKGPLTVKIKDTDPTSFSAMIKCIYTDQVEVDSTNIHTLIKVASKYSVEKLRAACAEFMETDINKDNVIDLFQIAPEMLGDEEFGMKFIEENTEAVLKSDGVLRLTKERMATILKSDKLNISELELFKVLQRWAEHQAKKKDTDASIEAYDLVKYIRFPLIELSDFAQTVAASNFLESSQLVSLFSYISVADEKVRESLPDPGFSTKPRAGEGTSGSGPWTWDTKKKGRSVALSNNNLTAGTSGYSWNNGFIMGTKEFKNGNHYWELQLDYSNNDMIGVASPSVPYDGSMIYSTYPSMVWLGHHGSGTYGGTIGSKSHLDLSARTGDRLGLALTWNKSNSTFDLSFYKNRSLMGTPFRGIPPPVVACCELYSTPARVTLDTKAKKP